MNWPANLLLAYEKEVIYMKKYVKEIIILLLQLSVFYIFPLFAGPADLIGMVSFLLSITLYLLNKIQGGI